VAGDVSAAAHALHDRPAPASPGPTTATRLRTRVPNLVPSPGDEGKTPQRFRTLADVYPLACM
jgi:hypothetical protein